MRSIWIVLSLATLLAAIPAQSQSTCRDGTASKASGRGACSHHGGVAKTAAPKPTATGNGSGDIVLPAASTPQASARAQAASANPRVNEHSGVKVWVNTKSGVYHCPGTRWYGATKSGEYMTEGEAKAAGDRPAYGRSCS